MFKFLKTVKILKIGMFLFCDVDIETLGINIKEQVMV